MDNNLPISPLYTISQYSDQIYKIVKFKSLYRGFRDCSSDSHHDKKLDSAFSRARRVILELALCNHWDFFFTGTFNPVWWDRFNLKVLCKKVSQWIRDRRKVYGSALRFLLIPEPHEDGSWHFHGLISDIPLDCLSDFDPKIHPIKLCNKGYKNWDDWGKKFGFCSLGSIKNPTAVSFYILKYITKDLSSRADDLGGHLYFCSQGLNRAIVVSQEFVDNSLLDSFLSKHFEFCDTGFTSLRDNLDWTFPLDFESFQPLYLYETLSDLDIDNEVSNLDTVNKYVQDSLAGWCNG